MNSPPRLPLFSFRSLKSVDWNNPSKLRLSFKTRQIVWKPLQFPQKHQFYATALRNDFCRSTWFQYHINPTQFSDAVNLADMRKFHFCVASAAVAIVVCLWRGLTNQDLRYGRDRKRRELIEVSKLNVSIRACIYAGCMMF